MAIKHKSELGLDPASAEIIVLRRLIDGDANELTISTEPTDWSVHLGIFRITMLNGKHTPVIRTVEELSARGVVFETSLEDKYLVNAVPPAVRNLINALATGKADQVRTLYPLSW